MEVSAGKVVAIIIVLFLVVTGNLFLLKYTKKWNDVDKSLKRIVTVLALSGMINDAFNLSSLLISSAAGEWPLGSTTCEVFGFLSTLLTASASWLVTLAALERYFKLLIPSEHTSTFSARNLQIMVAGCYILFFMAATGPLYGFGEYSYLKGHLPMYVLVNTSTSPISEGSPAENEMYCENRLMKVMKQWSATNQDYNLLLVVYGHLISKYNILINQPNWDNNGLRFYIRALSKDALERLMLDYENLTIFEDIGYTPCVTFEGKETKENYSSMYTYISRKDYTTYRDIYMPIQELGLCSTDLTSPNRQSEIWLSYYVTITFVLPYFILLACLCIIYYRSASRSHLANKDISESDVYTTNILCTSSVLSCCCSLFFYAATLSNADDIYIHPDVMFAAVYLYYTRSLLFVLLVLLISDCCSSCTVKRLLKVCGLYAKEALSYEMSEFDFSRTLTENTSLRGAKGYPTHV